MLSDIENRRARFYDRVILLDPKDMRDAVVNEVIESGGSYTVPQGESWPASHLAEISLHGVSSFGATEDEAISNWIRQARRVIRAEVEA
ncbi:hypothetical protein [Celeribacter ethanolicus]|uniref:hypothetical protein n=1 Tax=Celeribacter ethanolicus TaxID=1758178 RepID=UPI0008378A4B|nr:hypothetical protein [Celeribacter ethanolicus]